MDRGYGFPDIREEVKKYSYTAHIKSLGEENIRVRYQVLGQKDGSGFVGIRTFKSHLSHL
ncbi:hypothetical protein ASJ81_05835 [Methanosarcina spelaei]|uniref:Uncharacterized protein n=1 Tax=Methanosarcina spelaei TaxID=1036679 RepID=A0A2A2HU36_9EURY|nr:hypothetical protein ASJ81_05835 [Methanosarcina spelaei]